MGSRSWFSCQELQCRRHIITALNADYYRTCLVRLHMAFGEKNKNAVNAVKWWKGFSPYPPFLSLYFLFCWEKREHLCVFTHNCPSYKKMKLRDGKNLTSIHWKQFFKAAKHIHNAPVSAEINRRWCYCDVCVRICPSYMSKIGTTHSC